MDDHPSREHRSPDPIAHTVLSDASGPEPIRVLLIDDSAASLVQIQSALTTFPQPLRMQMASNGQEAISLLQADGADLVITDLEMPYGDGFSVLSFIKRSGKNVPVIVVTGLAPHDYSTRLDPFGSVVVLAKPVDKTVLGREVTTLLEEAGAGRLRGVTLPGFLQLIEMERKSCAIRVRAHNFMGRLHFRSGELVNAYTLDDGVEGEAAAKRLLAVESADIEIERSYHNHKRLIERPLQALLLEVATEHDLQLAATHDRTADSEGVTLERRDGGSFTMEVPGIDDADLRLAVERLLQQVEILTDAASTLTSEAEALKTRLDQDRESERLRSKQLESMQTVIAEILKAIERTLVS
jgi:CheY-like chemotaxis protein